MNFAWYRAADFPASLTVTVGAGGTAGLGGHAGAGEPLGVDGGAGGTTSIANASGGAVLMNAFGGGGGPFGSAGGAPREKGGGGGGGIGAVGGSPGNSASAGSAGMRQHRTVVVLYSGVVVAVQVVTANLLHPMVVRVERMAAHPQVAVERLERLHQVI